MNALRQFCAVISWQKSSNASPMQSRASKCPCSCYSSTLKSASNSFLAVLRFDENSANEKAKGRGIKANAEDQVARTQQESLPNVRPPPVDAAESFEVYIRNHVPIYSEVTAVSITFI